MDREEGGGSASPVAVLVASADDGTRAQVALTLGDSRFHVLGAGDTEGAIRRVATDRPPLLVLDADLPGAGSVALARTVRSQPETAATRILLLIDRGGASPGADGAIDETLSVPFTAVALLRKVELLLAPSSAAPT